MLRRISTERVDPRKWWPKVQTRQRKSAGARPLISDRRVLLDEIRRDPSVGTNGNNLPFPRPLTLALQYRSVGCKISKLSRGKAIRCCQPVWRIDTPRRAPDITDGTKQPQEQRQPGNPEGCGRRLTLVFHLCTWQAPRGR